MAKKATIHSITAKAEETTGTKPQHQPRWERAKVVCEYLKISPTTLWHWAKYRPDFPQPVKAGPRVTLFDLAAIDRHLQQGGTQ